MFPLNLPNALTLLRILAVPVVVVALLGETPNGDALAAAVFALAALTDGLDGYFARSRDSVTTFGKLMDPLADKLLIIGALVSLVSLDRLEAWVAMVIIAREVAVTILRTIAAERGVGDRRQLARQAEDGAADRRRDRPDRRRPGAARRRPARLRWRSLVTVVSGADYFFGLRRRIEQQQDESGRSAMSRGSRLDLGSPTVAGDSSHSRIVRWRRCVLAAGQLRPQLAEGAVALGHHVVAVDRLQVLLARHHEGLVRQVGVALDHLAHHLPHAVLDEARVARAP